MENNKDLLFSKAELIIKQAQAQGASQVQASIIMTNLNLTRLANSIIDQNVAENHFRIRALLYFGKKGGSVSFEVFEDDDIRDAVSQAASLAKISKENSDFKSLPFPKKYPTFDMNELISSETYETTPELRAEYAKLAIDTAHDVDKRVEAVAGYVQNITRERVVKNSLGIEGYEMQTISDMQLTILSRDSTEETAGWSGDARRDIRELKVEEVAKTAAEKSVNGFGMRDLSPGDYEVVLEPAAAAGLLMYTGLIGFGARRHQEYMSFLRDRMGEQVFSDKMKLVDNALDSRLVGKSLFDDEGVPHQEVNLIEKGVVKNLVYDTFTANKDGVESTGNNARWWGPPEPIPRHLIMSEGTNTIHDMIEDTKKGVLVTHFHYMNPVNPTEGVLTALTRDGTWYIENGEIKYPLRTLRFTDEIPRFLSSIDLIGTYSEFQSRPPTGLIPALKLPSFRFSGSSKE